MKLRRGDIFLICGVLVVAAALWAVLRPGGKGEWAVVTVGGLEIARYPLNQDWSGRIGDGHYNVLQIQNGSVSVTDANCGDLTCVRMGKISRVGESIVCLPHQLTISIEGPGDTPFDAVS